MARDITAVITNLQKPHPSSGGRAPRIDRRCCRDCSWLWATNKVWLGLLINAFLQIRTEELVHKQRPDTNP